MLGRAIALASGICSLALLAHAAEPTLLHVNTFPTARSLPFYVAVDRGFFARRGLTVELEFTESSERQRQGLAGGTVDIVHSAVDNAVAMIDVAKVDIVIVSGAKLSGKGASSAARAGMWFTALMPPNSGGPLKRRSISSSAPRMLASPARTRDWLSVSIIVCSD